MLNILKLGGYFFILYFCAAKDNAICRSGQNGLLVNMTHKKDPGALSEASDYCNTNKRGNTLPLR